MTEPLVAAIGKMPRLPDIVVRAYRVLSIVVNWIFEWKLHTEFKSKGLRATMTRLEAVFWVLVLEDREGSLCGLFNSVMSTLGGLPRRSS